MTPIYTENAVILAPLAEYTDYPFRRACRRLGCYYAFTPLVNAACLTYAPERCAITLQRGHDEPWLGVQLLGSNPEYINTAMKIINRHEFDVLDLNMGCPVLKVTKLGAGANLCLNTPLALSCLDVMIKHSRCPVTAKIRILSMEDPEPTIQLAISLQNIGIQCLTIHGRLRKAVYSGPVAVNIIRAVRDAVKIPVIANGGIFDVATAMALRQATGCGRIMIARGAIGNPWIFKNIALHDTDPFNPTIHAHPDTAELCDIIEEHIGGMIELYGEQRGSICSRKLILAYLRSRGYSKDRKVQASHLSSLAGLRAFIHYLRTEVPVAVPNLPRTLETI